MNPVNTKKDAEESADPIVELALDLRWTWNHSTDELWRELDPELWEATQNPWLVLQAVSRDRLHQLLADQEFRAHVDALLERKRRDAQADAWFQGAYPDAPVGTVAYFSMEYMLSEALPIYSGGLGNVAGDQLKTASDLGVPVIGIGLLYQQGYFRQEIDSSGAQVALYPFNDPGQLPIRPLRDKNGDWLRIKFLAPGYALWIRAWEAQVGRRKLYLLDTNDPANLPAYRTITSELYGGGPELRLRQEIVLGVVGWRLLRALDIHPDVCHLNEGHAAFVVLERARWFMEDHQQPFDVALAATRAGNLFTTHTPVEAGFDRFSPELMDKYYRRYAEKRLKISLDDLLALGRANRDDHSEPFNMAYLAIRGSGAVNSVSRLHGQVSRGLFRTLFPGWPVAEVPVGHITNGIHVPTWDSVEADTLWTAACGEHRWRGTTEQLEENLRQVEHREIWKMRMRARRTLVEFTRGRLLLQRAYEGASQQRIAEASRVFDENHLTLGFARRFATYKRVTMLLHDPERLIRLLTNPQRPVQLIIAGKAHPKDLAGQAMIRQWTQFMRRPEVDGRAAFLGDYDMRLTQALVAGVDVWLNTPRRPWEASGTSGMKVLANGGLNLSELDGWWAEAYAPELGWAIGDGKEHDTDPAWDAAEADELYRLLEQEVVPAFYDRDRAGIPRKWVVRICESMARLTPEFSANRTVRQYTDEQYVPLAKAYRARAAESGKAAAELVAWERAMASQWAGVHFGEVAVEQRERKYYYSIEVHLGSIKPDDVTVEIYTDGLDAAGPLRPAAALSTETSTGSYRYTGAVPADRPAAYYTPRVIPKRAGALIPLEAAWIAWQK